MEKHQQEYINILKSYGKFIGGRGRKYLDSIPKFDCDEVSEAMKFAAKHLSYRLSADEFIAIVTAASASCVRIKQFIRQSKKTLAKSTDKESDAYKEALDAVDNLGPKLCELESAVKAGKKIVRRLTK